MSARGGRGRARGRARARGSATQDPPPRQPGTRDPAPRVDQADVGPRPGVPPAPRGAWGTTGGGAREQHKRPNAGDELAGTMEHMRLGDRGGGRGRREDRGDGGGGRGGRGGGRGGPERGGDKSVRARQRGGMLEQYSSLNFKTSSDTVQLSQTHHGVEGTKLSLLANYIPLMAEQNWIMYHYHCHFAPELERVDWRREVLKPHIIERGHEHRWVFDGMALYLMDNLGPEAEWTSKHPNPNTKDAPPVVIKLTRAATNAECHPSSPVGQHVTNVLFKKALRLMNLTPVGRSYYNMEKSYAIPEYHMEVYPGFSTAIAPFGEGRVMLQIDVKHRILRKDTAYDVMYEKYNTSQNDAEYQRKAQRALLGTTVMTTYNQKTYRITDIDFKARVTDTFDGKDGKVTFVDYYKQAYNITIHDLEQPMLVSKPKERDRRGGRTQMLYLVPELCFMTGLSDELANNFKVKQALQKVTRMDSNSRIKRYCEFAADLAGNEESQKNFKQWNLSFDSRPIEITGRRMPRTELYMANQTPVSFNHDRVDWSQEMKDKPLIMALDLTDWVLIHTQVDTAATEEFLRELANVARPLGFRFQGRPTMIPLRDNRDHTYKLAIQQNISSRTQLLFAVVSGSKSQYDVIKKLCCRDCPVISQCIKAKTLKKQGLRSIATKVMLQMQCKIGAELWAAKPPMIEGMRKPFMIVGIDVYHDSEKKGKSVVGIVSSLNKNMTRYYSQTTHQTGKQEIATSFKTTMFSALEKFRERNKRMPETVIVYRDGVGDGQLDHVLEQEIPQFKEAFQQAGDPNIKLLFIIVQKRINTRMFLKVPNRGYDNPPPGTVVDTEIVRPEWYDFFLVSQSVRQGTVSPTHYNVLYDSVGWTPDQVQKLTYLLTHLYYNWQGTIKVPAPCQYAHKLAYLVGTSIHDNYDTKLADKLWFL